jgi:RNA polymerase sigma factor (sigma-70 family)
MDMSDGELIRSCLRGDAAGWNALVDRYGRLVYSIPRKLGFSATDADDVFQTVFGIAYRRLAGLRDETRLSAWLIRCTYRECWRLKRAASTAAQLEDGLADDGTPAPEAVERIERQHIVRQALTAIDERCRNLLTALFLEAAERSYEEIAAALGMPVGSIGPTRARCFKKLETSLRGLGLQADV